MRWALSFLLACGHGEADADGDGWVASEDCDDDDPLVHPSAVEQCDGVDNDCDGAIDDGVGQAFWIDADQDGFGTAKSAIACAATPGLATEQGDCDDDDPDVHPGAEELCDGIDDDCDGDNPTPVDWYADADGDGFGDPATAVAACDEPKGHVLDATDCDDANALANPSEAEQCDNDFDDDCDGVVGDGSDPDGDGYVSDVCAGGTDCADADPDVHPGQPDACGDGIDQDCSGSDAFCGFDGEFDLADADAILTSKVANTDAGRLVAAGDMDGDGNDDVLVAAMNLDGGFVVPGPFYGTTEFQSVGHTLSGFAIRGAGRSIAVADADGDGLDDVAFGAPYGDVAGQFIVYGPVTADVDLDDESDVSLEGDVSTFCGHGSDLGDVDGDGIADAVVGAYMPDTSAGGVYVVYGPLTADVDLVSESDAVVEGSAVSTILTARIVRAGTDVDGDGIGDIAIASTGNTRGGTNAGGVYIVLGPVTIASLDDAALLVGPAPSALAGLALTLGDYDGDGFGDIATSTFSPGLGAVYVKNGPVAGEVDLNDAEVILDGVVRQDFGVQGLGTSDIDEDGVSELLVGGPGDDVAYTDAGATYLVSDPPIGSSNVEDVAQGIFRGGEADALTGLGLAAGDLDGSGYQELLIGGPGMDHGGGLSVLYATF